MKLLRYFHRVSLALNQLVNTLLFGGAPAETISAHAGRDGCPFPFTEAHCEQAIDHELGGMNQNPLYRTGDAITRRGALQLVGCLAFTGQTLIAAEPLTLLLDRPILVRHDGREITIEAGAMWDALQAAKKIPIT